MEESLENLGEHSYRRLPASVKKKGYDMVQIRRGARAVVYSGAADGTVLKYETFIIKKHDGRNFGGVLVAPAEYWPGDESYGDWAWNWGAWKGGLEEALRKFEEIEAGVNEKTENNAD